jgi:hypothetical protein
MFMAINLRLDAIDQDQNGSGDEDATCGLPTAMHSPHPLSETAGA